VRALERAGTRWLVLAATAVGFAFLTKMLQASWSCRPSRSSTCCGADRAAAPARQLLAGGVALVVSAGWWVAIVQLTPAADRPYIGGSQDNKPLNLIFGYNGLGRSVGQRVGSVGGPGGGGIAAGARSGSAAVRQPTWAGRSRGCFPPR
jgi:4-amino-4-deoxy-L-arabinose transferase-like glycosyltransferase